MFSHIDISKSNKVDCCEFVLADIEVLMKNHCMLGDFLALVLFSSFRMLNNFSKEFVDEKFSPLDYY